LLRNIDFKQVRTLARYALKSEWRQASVRSLGGRRKMSRAWAYWAIVIYLLVGIFLIRLFTGHVTGETYVTAASLVMLYLSIVTASNIFLSFGTGFLSPDESIIVSPLPVSSETFFFSRLIVLITYTTAITLTMTVGMFGGLVFYLHLPSIAGVWLLASCVLSSISAALLVVALYGLVLAKLPRASLTRSIGYVQFIGTMFTAFSFVILPRIEKDLDLTAFTLSVKPWLGAIPAFWFGSLAGVANGVVTSGSLVLAGAALLFMFGLALAAHVLLGKNYQTEVGELAASGASVAKRQKQNKDSIIFKLYMRFARSHEARAVFMIFRAQFRFDPKFRMSLIATLPLTFMYLVIAILQGGIHDPFTSNWRELVNANLLYIVALFMPLIVMQAVSQSENYRAAWAFFVTPIDRAKVLLAIRNTLVISIIIPYMIVLAITFSYFIPVVHAIEHVLVLAAIAGFVFQMFLMIAPRMPFAQPRRPNRSNVVVMLGFGFLAIIPLGLLALEIYFGYRSTLRFWSSFALLATLSLILEQAVRHRIRKKLDLEEFAG
jgi:ABC-2 type transport system permease protein